MSKKKTKQKKTIKNVHVLYTPFKNSNTVRMGNGGGGSRSAVVFADFPLDVRQFGPEIFTPFLLNFIVWRLQWTENNSNNYILFTE